MFFRLKARVSGLSAVLAPFHEQFHTLGEELRERHMVQRRVRLRAALQADWESDAGGHHLLVVEPSGAVTGVAVLCSNSVS